MLLVAHLLLLMKGFLRTYARGGLAFAIICAGRYWPMAVLISVKVHSSRVLAAFVEVGREQNKGLLL